MSVCYSRDVSFMAQESSLLCNPDAYPVFEKVLADLPSDCEPYLYGGAVRSAVFKIFHGETIPCRDYDQIVTRGSSTYAQLLRSQGFVDGRVPSRPEEHFILRYPLVNDSDSDSFTDSVVFDIHKADGDTVLSYLRYNVGINVGGIAVPLRKLFDADWFDNLVALPGAIDDIKQKRVSINPHGYLSQPANLYACLRLVSRGYAPPPEQELKKIVDQVITLSPHQIARNIKKLSDYVNGDMAIRSLVRSLGIKGDILDVDEVKSGMVSMQ